LLFDDGRADGREADDERDDLQMLRLAQQLEGLRGADPLLLLDRGELALVLLVPAHRLHAGGVLGVEAGAPTSACRIASV
jgi:hypothetical protein